MLLCDIGNSFAKFYDGTSFQRVPINEIDRYKDSKVCYINVNERIADKLRSFHKWIDLGEFIEFSTPYQGMGIDRQILCLVVEDGVVVDAGSAITVDVMQNGRHEGGFIMPGIRFLLEDFGVISPRLQIQKLQPVDIHKLPLSTQDALSYGIIKPIVLAIGEFAKPLFITGGDGEILARYFPGSHYDELMIFKGMMKIVKRNDLC